MEKRLPLFLFLSTILLVVWTLLNPRPPVNEGGDAGVAGETSETQAASGVGGDSAIEAFQPVIGETEEREETLFFGAPGEPGHFRIVVSNKGARIVELALGSYYRTLGLDEAAQADPVNWVRLLEPAETEDGTLGSLLLQTRPSSADLAPAGLDDVLWTMELLQDEAGGTRGVEWRYDPGRGVAFTKRLIDVPGSYRMRLELELTNTGAAGERKAEFLLLPAGCVPPALGDRFYEEPRAIAVGYDEDDDEYRSEWEDAASVRKEDGGLDVPTPLVLAGVHNKYFGLLVTGADDAGRGALRSATYRGVRDEAWLAENPGEEKAAWRFVLCEATLGLKVPEPGGTHAVAFDVFAGPKDPDVFAGEHPAFHEVQRTDLSGWTIFSVIGEFLLSVMRFFHGLVGNWGVAIILMTTCVRAVLFPLNRRSQTAMARYQTKMKRVQPKLNEIKEKYANNPQKLREEQARIMQEERAFPPLGGCLPPFLQIPVFFGLFAALRTAFELRHAPFAGWIDDLSRPDRLLEINLPLPLIGEIQYFNLLPILMVILWVVQQMGMPKPTDEQAARMQKMMMFMPVMMGFFLYSYAAGLSLYMITQSGLGIIEQRVIKKLWPIDDTELEAKEPKGCGPLSGPLQKMAERHQEEMKRLQAGQGRGGDAAKKAAKKKQRRI